MGELNVIVDKMERQGRGNLAVKLVAENGSDLPEFSAGAHIDLHLGNGLIRQYSIASSPLNTRFYELCIKREPASRGGSAFVHDQLRVGDVIGISRPRNLFPLVKGNRYLLIAGGIGITPILSMAEQLDAEGKAFELFYYQKESATQAYRERLNAGFKHGVVNILSSDRGQSPRQSWPELLDMPNADLHLYTCGPSEFMNFMLDQARSRGWSEANLHKEDFAPPAPKALEGDGTFEIELASSGAIYSVPPSKTIAAVLLEEGVAVPLSCEMGICGACLVPVLEGEADHRDTVQTDDEKTGANQHVALCCSRSKTDRIRVNL